MCCRAMDPDRPLFNIKIVVYEKDEDTLQLRSPELHVELFAVERGFALSGSTIDGLENGGRF